MIGARENTHLEIMQVGGNELGEKTEDQIEVHALLNKFRLARPDNNELAAPLWQFIIANCQTRRSGKVLVFYLLRENPNVLQLYGRK